MTTLLQILFTGFATGAIYALLAAGYAVGYSVSGVISFCHGQLLMVCVMVVSAVYTTSLIGGIIAGIAAAALVGAVIYGVAIWPVLRRSRGGFSWLVSTLGIAVILQAIAATLFGNPSRPFPQLFQDTRLTLGGASVTLQGIVAVACAAAVGVSLELFRRRSLFGKAAMAVAADPEAASGVGINATRTHLIAFVLAAVLAAIAGILVGPSSFANAYMGVGYGVKGFVALLLGGITNPTAALGGGIVLGLLEATAAVAVGPSTVDWLPLVVLFGVLLVAPNGVFAYRRLRAVP